MTPPKASSESTLGCNTGDSSSPTPCSPHTASPPAPLRSVCTLLTAQGLVLAPRALPRTAGAAARGAQRPGGRSHCHRSATSTAGTNRGSQLTAPRTGARSHTQRSAQAEGEPAQRRLQPIWERRDPPPAQPHCLSHRGDLAALPFLPSFPEPFPAKPDLCNGPGTADTCQAPREPGPGPAHHPRAEQSSHTHPRPSGPGLCLQPLGGAGQASPQAWSHFLLPRASLPQAPRPGGHREPTAPGAHQRQEAVPCSAWQLTAWQGPSGPHHYLCPSPPGKSGLRAAGSARSPLWTHLGPQPFPPGRSGRYQQGGPARPSAIAPLPLPAPTEPSRASSRPPARRAIGQPRKHIATLLAAPSVYQSRPTPLAYATGAAKEPHPSRPRKESKQGGRYH